MAVTVNRTVFGRSADDGFLSGSEKIHINHIVLIDDRNMQDLNFGHYGDF
jgi:hypothetical protein